MPYTKRLYLGLFLGVFFLPVFAQTDQKNITRNWQVGSEEKNILALVIGNSLYEHNGQLSEPANDAQTIAKALREKGASVLVAYNLDLITMKQQFMEFSRALNHYKAGVVYFAGHGFQVRGKNYLVPVDAAPRTMNEVGSYCVELNELLNLINDGNKPKIILLDACRDNPFSRNWTTGERSGSVGFTGVNSRDNTLIMFSTAEGTTVKDDNPFAEVFAEEVRQGTCAGELAPNVFVRVRGFAPEQRIYQEGFLLNPFCFGEAVVGAQPAALQQAAAVLPEAEDGDGDGIPDVDDECPGQKGYRSLGGCDLKPLAEWRRIMDAIGLDQERYDREIVRLLDTGLPAAKSRAAYVYIVNKGRAQDIDAGLSLAKEAARYEDAFGEYILGCAYFGGLGVGINYTSATHWFKKAAGRGLADAQFALAKNLEDGVGIQADQQAAFYWMSKAANTGYVIAENGLGNYFYYGTGTPQNLSQAFTYYQRAAKKGYPLAQTNLGNCYLSGQGTTASVREATYWFEEAFAAGDPAGIYTLGHGYLEGILVPHDVGKGETLLKRAAKAGSEPAQTLLRELNIRW